MPVFRFVQKQTITYEIIVRAENSEQATEYAVDHDDDFPTAESEWDDITCEELDDEAVIDVDLTTGDKYNF